MTKKEAWNKAKEYCNIGKLDFTNLKLCATYDDRYVFENDKYFFDFGIRKSDGEILIGFYDLYHK